MSGEPSRPSEDAIRQAAADHAQYQAEQDAIDEKQGLVNTLVGALPVMMGYDPTEPPPPPPPQPPDTSTSQDGDVSDVVDIKGDSTEPEIVDTGDATFAPIGPTDAPPQQFDAPAPDHVSPLFGPKPTFGPDDAYDGQALEEEAKREEAERRRRLDTDLTPAVNDYGATFATSEPQPTPAATRPGWVWPAAAAAVVLVGAIGFAVTRGGSVQTAPVPQTTAAPSVPAAPATAPTAAATVAPTNAAPQSAARVMNTRIDEAGNVCLNATTFTVFVQVTGAKAGDAIHLTLTGPGLPPSADGRPLDADLRSSTVVGTVGPVKGTQSWSAAVDAIGGQRIVSGPSQVFGSCPSS